MSEGVEEPGSTHAYRRLNTLQHELFEQCLSTPLNRKNVIWIKLTAAGACRLLMASRVEEARPAFRRANARTKLIVMTVGVSQCEWCRNHSLREPGDAQT